MTANLDWGTAQLMVRPYLLSVLSKIDNLLAVGQFLDIVRRFH
jgi:hypothetical protein